VPACTAAPDQKTCAQSHGTKGTGSQAVVCAGIVQPAGTGSWQFAYQTTKQGLTLNSTTVPAGQDSQEVSSVVFTRFETYWGPKPKMEQVKVVRYNSSDEIKQALVNGSLDMAYGAGIIHPAGFNDMRKNYADRLATYMSNPLNTRTIIINSGKAPTNDLQLRKAVIHAVDKRPVLAEDLGGVEEIADSLFPRTLPYCDIELRPKLDYDKVKAELLLEYAGGGWLAAARLAGWC
jgi:nickel transport system substrate-binding protein